jgi:F-type H+-transporting ATPase subunit a
LVTLAFFSLIPVFVPIPFMILHLLVALVQAFVFMALAMSYLSLSTSHDH